MNLVDKPSQIEENCFRLSEKIEKKENISEITELVRRGRCFVKYIYNGKNRFFPSKFVGYSGNNIEQYIKAKEEKRIKKIKRDFDGRHTNKRIKKITHKKFVKNIELDNQYIKFCEELKITPTNVKRKYIIL